jgi:hypothetical protein
MKEAERDQENEKKSETKHFTDVLCPRGSGRKYEYPIDDFLF